MFVLVYCGFFIKKYLESYLQETNISGKSSSFLIASSKEEYLFNILFKLQSQNIESNFALLHSVKYTSLSFLDHPLQELKRKGYENNTPIFYRNFHDFIFEMSINILIFY